MTGKPTQTLSLGLCLWSEQTAWPALREAFRAADEAGWDSLWTWDHLLPVHGSDEEDILEGWTVLTAAATVTTRARLGVMVTANTFRNPGLIAKMAATLDQISDGRAILGIGAAWYAREHDAFGLEFGSAGERVERVAEALPLIRQLLDGETVSHTGRYYQLNHAICRPRPVQESLPILVGGSGPRLLQVVASYADAWNVHPPHERAGAREAALAAAIESAGRPQSAVERTVLVPGLEGLILRDSEAEALKVFSNRPFRTRHPIGTTVLAGPPVQVARRLRPYVESGFHHLIFELAPPIDLETIVRIEELRAELVAA